MKPCPHKHVEARIWSRWGHWIVVDSYYASYPDALICRDCGEWLGLGESKDDSEAVRAEILGAFLAMSENAFVRVAHKDHHDTEDCDEYYCFEHRDDCVGCLGEWLRGQIWLHQEAK